MSHQLSAGDDTGLVVGQTGDKIAFMGATPTAVVAMSSMVTAGATTAADIAAALVELYDELVAKGLVG